jgi:EpsI family protein
MNPNRVKPPSYFAYCLAILVLAGFGFNALQYWLYGRGQGPARPLRIPLAQFPRELGEWRATSVGLEDDVREALRLSDSWAATYADAKGDQVSLFIGYYPDENVGKLHQPTICYPASGWTTVSKEVISLKGPGAGESDIEANRVTFKKGLSSQIVLYWYHFPGGTVADPSLSKVYRLAQALRGRDSRSIVKVQVGLPMSESLDKTMAQADAFLRPVMAKLYEHLGPAWAIPVVAGEAGSLGGS